MIIMPEVVKLRIRKNTKVKTDKRKTHRIMTYGNNAYKVAERHTDNIGGPNWMIWSLLGGLIFSGLGIIVLVGIMLKNYINGEKKGKITEKVDRKNRRKTYERYEGKGTTCGVARIHGCGEQHKLEGERK